MTTIAWVGELTGKEGLIFHNISIPKQMGRMLLARSTYQKQIEVTIEIKQIPILSIQDVKQFATNL